MISYGKFLPFNWRPSWSQGLFSKTHIICLLTMTWLFNSLVIFLPSSQLTTPLNAIDIRKMQANIFEVILFYASVLLPQLIFFIKYVLSDFKQKLRYFKEFTKKKNHCLDILNIFNVKFLLDMKNLSTVPYNVRQQTDFSIICRNPWMVYREFTQNATRTLKLHQENTIIGFFLSTVKCIYYFSRLEESTYNIVRLVVRSSNSIFFFLHSTYLSAVKYSFENCIWKQKANKTWKMLF